MLLLLPLVLGCIGIVMIGSTAYSGSLAYTGDMKVQSMAFLLGLLSIGIILLIDYQVFDRLQKPFYVIGILLLLAVFLPGLGSEQYGTRGWIDLGPLNLQPSEVCKVIFILVLASYLSRREEELHGMRDLIFCGLFILPYVGLILLQGDLGNALVYLVITVVMVYYAGIDGKLYAKVAVAGCAMLPLAYFCLHGYQKLRIDAFLHPNDLSLPGNYQVWNSKVALGSGGFFGKGLNNSYQKLLYMTYGESDFIFAILCEEFGFVGGLIVILMYGWIVFRGIVIAMRCRNRFGSLLAAGVSIVFGFQVFVNIGVVTGLLPTTGQALPFISAGGTSLLVFLAAMGLLLSISRDTNPRG